MTHTEIRKKFLEFFESRGHTIVPSSSLVPHDPSVLFTTAGMQQFKPYFTGTADPIKDFGSKNVASVQKAMRTSDIDKVGDDSHFTFFQMLGHFSFGGYFKKETIEWTHQLLTDIFKISPDRISATVFIGDDRIPLDSESYEAWIQFLPKEKIKKGSRENNVWGPVGPEGPCGAANEVYVDDLEVATLVFMEYYCDKVGNLSPLPQKNVDVGWGFERIVKIIQGKSIFETDLFEPLIKIMPDNIEPRIKRIITDHLRASVFLIADGVIPSNKERGYILRRLLRRSILYEHINNLSPQIFEDIIIKIIDVYNVNYPELKNKKNEIINGYFAEREKFKKTLSKGIKELKSLNFIDTKEAFKLYESYGLPFEVIKELGGEKAKTLNQETFNEEFKKHQEKSRASAEKKFGTQ